jgi:hypothetical protein
VATTNHIDQNVAGFVESVNSSFKLTPIYQCSIKNLVNLVTYSHPGFVLPRPLRNQQLSNEINKAKLFEKNTALTAYSDKEI